MPGPAHEIEIIIGSLRDDVGRDLGDELITAIRRAMGPLDRETRANLCAAVDNAFEAPGTVAQARQKALALLPDSPINDP
ncbi:hypothetical protein [Kushneria phosphatilytica]|uniref:Uncharacterized protein n=1 Tax=Kushneria phosphatilytica TaxID=657387 RepID=A0A1S1NRD0_9GAMM|nr:hypothetical protein [Kushneria phosphatilytica]OHV07479.1 hypothetical protein BH688_14665 [Kushneria phosphatilytica]QEL09959.1 hypothetical protein FY550_01635 [Kushneria phosphatilytica]